MAENCSYFLGIPLHETADCRHRRVAQREKRRQDNARYHLAKQKERLGARGDRVNSRTLRSLGRSNAGIDPAADVGNTIAASFAAIAPAVAAAANPLSALGGLGGGSTPPPPPPGPDLAPLAIGAAAVGIAILVWSR